MAYAKLPLEGVPESFRDFAVAESPTVQSIAAGLGRYGAEALLRSVVVHPAHAQNGLGAAVTRHVLEQADAAGIRSLSLLTTNAERFFERFGFNQVPRSNRPATLQDSAELQGACPSSAAAMMRIL